MKGIVGPSAQRASGRAGWTEDRSSEDILGAMLWCIWRASLWQLQHVALAGAPGAVDSGVLWLDFTWRRDVPAALHAWRALQRITGVPCLQGLPTSSAIPRYRKVAHLVEVVVGCVLPGSAAELLSAVETFASLSAGQWLKVAGGSKGQVLSSARSRTSCSCCPDGVMLVEFGAFVGYTAARLAPKGAACIISVEQDPIHVVVARTHLNLALLSSSAEVLPGRVMDAQPALFEIAGTFRLQLCFMDQGGSSFPVDHARLERLNAAGPNVLLVSDNVVRPGAPVFVARLGATVGETHGATHWAMPEFLEEKLGIEDWMTVAHCAHH